MRIDIRKNEAYAQGHIPGALSFPFIHNPEKWREQLLDFSHPDWADFKAAFAAFFRAHPSNTAHIYCHTGTWRSHAFAALAQAMGIPVEILPGGYRAFQEERDALFHRAYPIVVLAGETGSGKTALLEELCRRGEQVIDLEKLAEHKGSAFGRLEHARPQLLNEQFKNDLAETLRRVDSTRVIWVEDEGKSLGRAGIPQPFWQQMQRAPVIKLEVPLARRIENILAQYGHIDQELIITAIHNITQRLGEATPTAIAALRDRQMEATVRLVLRYYDQAYALQMQGRDVIATLHVKDGDLERVSSALRKMCLDKVSRIQK
ncbi:MAG: rhodanese-like domain-containing protein [Desulfobulbia bacterium]|nr:MAG: tRNA 2-selenouridine(34) synthase MnmH [Deltaproteobacteria bacterium HGW-Deltaproteobacteria-16]